MDFQDALYAGLVGYYEDVALFADADLVPDAVYVFALAVVV